MKADSIQETSKKQKIGHTCSGRWNDFGTSSCTLRCPLSDSRVVARFVITCQVAASARKL